MTWHGLAFVNATLNEQLVCVLASAVKIPDRTEISFLSVAPIPLRKV